MNRKSIYLILTVALLAFVTTVAWPQATLTRVSGRVTYEGKPVPDAQVVFTNLNTGKTFKGKTDKNGSYQLVGLERTGYQVEVSSATGEKIYSAKESITGETGGQMGGEQQLNIEVSAKGQPKMSKEERAAIEAQNAKALSMNELISQANAAMNAKNWEGAIPVLQQLTQEDPNRWRFLQGLGDAQLNLGQYEPAIASYDKGIQIAQKFLSGELKDPKNPDADPARAKTGLAQMLQNQGNAYLKIKKNPEAIAAFEKAASMDPNPGTAYFNICATQYNTGNMEGAEAACDKAIAAGTTKADAYFIKGSAMYSRGKTDANNKWTVPPGTTEVLNKYLQVAPDGPHASDVKALLESVGVKIETTYKARKK